MSEENKMITEQEYMALRQQGYTDKDILVMVNQQAQQQQQTQAEQGQPTTYYSQGRETQNLIQWQLEIDSILERIEHLLRGDKPVFEKGSVRWIAPKTDEERVFNEQGVAEIMRLLGMYLNRNTILSNYDEQTIRFKIYDLGCDLSDLIYMKYDQFGLDSDQKRKLYPMIIRQIVDAIHSSYLRALHGGERESLQKSTMVTQTNSMEGYPQGMLGFQKERGMLNPLRYIFGKTK